MAGTAPSFAVNLLTSRLPCVYGWKRDGRYLYVGASRNGLARPCSRHHVIGVAEAVTEEDVVDVWVCLTIADALRLEGELIEALAPVYNQKAGFGLGRTKFRPIRLDDDVWEELQRLRRVRGTMNRALRTVFKLTP